MNGNLNSETLAAPEVLVNPKYRAGDSEVPSRIVAPSPEKREAARCARRVLFHCCAFGLNNSSATWLSKLWRPRISSHRKVPARSLGTYKSAASTNRAAPEDDLSFIQNADERSRFWSRKISPPRYT